MKIEVEKRVEENEPQRLPVWVCLLLFAGGIFVFMGVYGGLSYGVLSLIMGKDVQKDGLLTYIVTEASMLLAVLTSAIILLHFERRSFSDLGLTVKGHAKGFLYGTLMAIVLYLLGFGLSLVLGEVKVTGIQFDPEHLLGTWVFCLLVALAEEIMVRGYILGRLLHTRLNKFLSLFISAVLFALLHIFNPNVAFLPMLNLVLAGILLGVSYLYTRNLCFPIALHLFWNWIQGPVLGYQVSGMHLGASVLTLHLPEENRLNGGAFGFEGSLICTMLMLIFTILIIWWGEKREAVSLATLQSC